MGRQITIAGGGPGLAIPNLLSMVMRSRATRNRSESAQKALERFKAAEQSKLEHIRCCNQLSVEQFKSLRTQIDTTLKELKNLELYALAGVIAYYAWLFTHCIPSIYIPVSQYKISISPIIWFIPVLLPMLGAWRVWVNIGNILIAADYIREIEDEFDDPLHHIHIGPDKGWENYLYGLRMEDKMEDKGKKSGRIPQNQWRKRVWAMGLKYNYWPFWFLLMGLTTIIFVASFFISGSLSQQTCHTSSAPTIYAFYLY